jgi:hypothetical protein
MKRLGAIMLFTVLPVSLAVAMVNCDLNHFRWDCELPFKTRPSHTTQSMVYCGNIKGYLTPAQYETLVRYYRRNINMVLKVNDEYVNSPCVPMRQYDYRE